MPKTAPNNTRYHVVRRLKKSNKSSNNSWSHFSTPFESEEVAIAYKRYCELSSPKLEFKVVREKVLFEDCE